MTKYDTPFAETEALMGVLDHDKEYAVSRIKTMFPNERLSLAYAALELSILAFRACLHAPKPPDLEHGH